MWYSTLQVCALPSLHPYSPTQHSVTIHYHGTRSNYYHYPRRDDNPRDSPSYLMSARRSSRSRSPQHNRSGIPHYHFAQSPSRRGPPPISDPFEVKPRGRIVARPSEDEEITEEAAPTELTGQALYDDLFKTLRKHKVGKWSIP